MAADEEQNWLICYEVGIVMAAEEEQNWLIYYEVGIRHD